MICSFWVGPFAATGKITGGSGGIFEALTTNRCKMVFSPGPQSFLRRAVESVVVVVVVVLVAVVCWVEVSNSKMLSVMVSSMWLSVPVFCDDNAVDAAVDAVVDVGEMVLVVEWVRRDGGEARVGVGRVVAVTVAERFTAGLVKM